LLIAPQPLQGQAAFGAISLEFRRSAAGALEDYPMKSASASHKVRRCSCRITPPHLFVADYNSSSEWGGDFL